MQHHNCLSGAWRKGWIRHCKAESGVHDGIEGPPTEPQTDGSRRTILGARNGLQ
jgi:hypothetical protein